MRVRLLLPLLLSSLLFSACGSGSDIEPAPEPDMVLDLTTVRDTTDRLMSITGFSGPEAVRYDPEQDVFFVANFNGSASGDANGFISRINAETGALEALEFAVGTEAHPMHGPRGMFITGDTLWAADADGIHGIDRRDGTHLAFVDFTAFEPGFLNDIAQGGDGALYITDTGGTPRLYRRVGASVEVVVADTSMASPNGVVWDAVNRRLLLAPWGGRRDHKAWNPATGQLEDAFTLSRGGRFDGIEPVGADFITTSQNDSLLYLIEDGVERPLVEVPGRPADIGYDTRRNRVAVPYIARDAVDIWSLLEGE